MKLCILTCVTKLTTTWENVLISTIQSTFSDGIGRH